MTIAGLLGHTLRGVSQRYFHLDAVLAVATNQVSAEIAKLLDGESKSNRRPTTPGAQTQPRNVGGGGSASVVSG